MNRHRLLTLAALLSVFLLVIGSAQSVGAQKGQNPNALARSYHADGQGNRPEWATQAMERSLDHLEKQGFGRDNFVLRSVEQDGFATHVRLDQQYKNLPVFGGQAVLHLDTAGNVVDQGGLLYDVNMSTATAISSQQATKIAFNALGLTATRGAAPEGMTQATQLVVLAFGLDKPVLAYQVSIHIEDGTDATAHHEYFVNATDGSITFYFNGLDTSDATGTGKSLYSGTVSVHTDYTSGTYYLRDLTRGGMDTIDMRNRTRGGYYFTDSDNVWGNFSTSSSQSAAVDAHFGAAQTWDYYLSAFGRRGIDGAGYMVRSFVHYGRRYNNAFWNGSYMTYGDGDGSTFSPLVSMDVAGHEITHGLTEKTAGLIYSNESGASNEAFSDIFGSMVEFYTYGSGGNYLIGEDVYTPSVSGDALRSMSNPTAYGDPDHYSRRYTGTSDNGGVHTNSGIQNHAFYLLAEGGTNRTSGQSVSGIGRSKAAAIFYRALTVYLYPSANFSAVRSATLSAARDLYGSGSAEYNATAQAWSACGVY